eukprot:3492646-Rhodomonas_salina.2
MELKQEQTAFLNAADSAEAEERSSTVTKLACREYPTTELEEKVIVVAETVQKGKGLFAACDIRSGDFVCKYWGLQ